MNIIRTGRPKSLNPKEKSIKVRFDTETFQKLSNYCEQRQQTKAEVIRESVQEKLEKVVNK